MHQNHLEGWLKHRLLDSRLHLRLPDNGTLGCGAGCREAGVGDGENLQFQNFNTLLCDSVILMVPCSFSGDFTSRSAALS